MPTPRPSAAVVKGEITFSISTMEDGRAKMYIALMATPAKHRLSFHMTCPEDNTVDIWGDGAEDGTPIRIYTTGGRLVAAAPLMGGSVSLPVGSPAGVYAVQVGTLGSTLIRK